jgi:hypothetical protein
VTSVINSYTLSGSVNLSGQFAEAGRGDQTASVGINGAYEDRPTITYSPLTGDKFARSLLTPIPVNSILYLLQTGYPADLVLRMTVNSINGLENAFGGIGNTHPGNPSFFELIEAMRISQAAGLMGIRIRQHGEKQDMVIDLRPSAGEPAGASNRRIRELLGLDPDARELTIRYASFPVGNTDIAILSRSMLQIMTDLAAYIDVPPGDAAEGRVHVPFSGSREHSPPSALIRIRQGETPPPDAFVATRYRDHWFWIDDRDVRSKSLFGFLMFMFALTETGESRAGAPIVTVPAR